MLTGGLSFSALQTKNFAVLKCKSLDRTELSQEREGVNAKEMSRN